MRHREGSSQFLGDRHDASGGALPRIAVRCTRLRIFGRVCREWMGTSPVFSPVNLQCTPSGERWGFSLSSEAEVNDEMTLTIP